MSPRREFENFWDFSVRTYSTKGVPDACLSMQNDHGADVNMLMYCCWVGVHFGQFDDHLFDRASIFSEDWAENVVSRLRSARKWMKHTGCMADDVPTDQCMQLREQIKSIELAAEKMQQDVLATFPESNVLCGADSSRPTLESTAANLFRYSSYAGINVSDEVREKFAVIVLAAIPDSDVEMIRLALFA